MNRAILIIIALLISGCVSVNEPRAPEKKFEVQVKSINIEFVQARAIALQYLSHVSWFDYDGDPIVVEKCNGTESKECHYYVSHAGNGCGWGSFVIEQCTSGKCHYNFSPYNSVGVVCE